MSSSTARKAASFLGGAALVAAIAAATVFHLHRPVSNGGTAPIDAASASESPQPRASREPAAPRQDDQDSGRTYPVERSADGSDVRANVPLDAVVVGPSGIDIDTAEHLLAGDFDAALRRLGSDNLGDQDVQDLTRLYADSIQGTLASVAPDAAIGAMACGRDVCGLDIRTKTSDASPMTAVMNSGGTGPEIYSAVSRTVRLPDGSFSQRMFFATNPSMRALRVPTQAAPAR